MGASAETRHSSLVWTRQRSPESDLADLAARRRSHRDVYAAANGELWEITGTSDRIPRSNVQETTETLNGTYETEWHRGLAERIRIRNGVGVAHEASEPAGGFGVPHTCVRPSRMSVRKGRTTGKAPRYD